MTTVFLDAVFKPFFKIVHGTGQQLTIDQTDGFLQIIECTGFVSVNTWFQFHPPQKKSRVERLGERGGHGMSLKREMRCRGNVFWTMVIDSFAVCTVAPSCWNHTLAQSPPQPTYWVLPIQKMSRSRGSPCTAEGSHYITTNIKLSYVFFSVLMTSSADKDVAGGSLFYHHHPPPLTHQT